jgi:predicted nucleic acid-binding protein
LIRKGNICFKIIEFWKEDRFILVTSREILKEIADVLKRPFLVKKYGYDRDEVDSMINLIA